MHIVCVCVYIYISIYIYVVYVCVCVCVYSNDRRVKKRATVLLYKLIEYLFFSNLNIDYSALVGCVRTHSSLVHSHFDKSSIPENMKKFQIYQIFDNIIN